MRAALLTAGQSAWALIAVNAEESQATIDGILTLGLLWLSRCRERAEGVRSGQARHVEGLRVIVPEGQRRGDAIAYGLAG